MAPTSSGAGLPCGSPPSAEGAPSSRAPAALRGEALKAALLRVARPSGGEPCPDATGHDSSEPVTRSRARVSAGDCG